MIGVGSKDSVSKKKFLKGDAKFKLKEKLLGFEFCGAAGSGQTVGIREVKKEKYSNQIRQALKQLRGFVTLHAMQSLHGKLGFVTNCIPYLRGESSHGIAERSASVGQSIGRMPGTDHHHAHVKSDGGATVPHFGIGTARAAALLRQCRLCSMLDGRDFTAMHPVGATDHLASQESSLHRAPDVFETGKHQQQRQRSCRRFRPRTQHGSVNRRFEGCVYACRLGQFSNSRMVQMHGNEGNAQSTENSFDVAGSSSEIHTTGSS